jgi:thioredoxin reductase (NADPH)
VPVYTAADVRGERSAAFAGEALVVVCLCAAWCDSCRAFRATYEALAERDASAVYVWLDVEDDADVVGDVDIETFPTLAVYRGERLLHYGVSLPQAATVARVIAAAAQRGERAADAPAPIAAVPRALRGPGT